MAIYRKKKFPSAKKVGGPGIGAAHAQEPKSGGRGPPGPIAPPPMVNSKLDYCHSLYHNLL